MRERATAVFCPEVTTTARTPEEAVLFLGELGTGIRASVVLDREGRVAASSCQDERRAGQMGDLALELLERAERSADGKVLGSIEVSTRTATVFAARRPRWSVAIVVERMALSSLVLFDLHRVLVDLEGATA